MKTRVLITLVVIALLGCNKENVSPQFEIVSNPAFETLFLTSELPDDVGENSSGILFQDPRDAMGLDDGSMLINIGGRVYKYSNGIFIEKIANNAQHIAKTSDGNIYILGRDALYTSTDGGESFTIQEKIISNLGTDYALDVYYNGAPNRIVVQKITGGEYIMWLTREYEYHLGGTGFTQTQYINYAFTSTNGINWTFKENEGFKFTGYVIGIQEDGTSLFVEINLGDGINFNPNPYTLHGSKDLGKTDEILIEAKPNLPNVLSPTNKIFAINSISHNDRFESGFSQWNESSWVNLNPTIDEKAQNTNNNQLNVLRVNFTVDGRMILVNSVGIYISNKSF